MEGDVSHMTNKMSNIDGWSSNAQEKDETFKLDDCVGLHNAFRLCPSCARHTRKMIPPETSSRFLSRREIWGPTSPLATSTRSEDQCSFSGWQNRVNAFRIRACNHLLHPLPRNRFLRAAPLPRRGVRKYIWRGS